MLTVVNAREYPLKNLSLSLPRGTLIVVTGPSGCGKSTLVFDTLYAEGQRRYVASLSTYTRRFFAQQARPAVDRIDGLSPTLAVEQKPLTRSPRSTVGTVTEINDLLRLLFARAGTPFCPSCNQEIEAHTAEEIVTRVLTLPEGTRFSLLAPILRGEPGNVPFLVDTLRRQGFVRARLDGQGIDLGDPPPLDHDPATPHTLEVILDRLVVQEGMTRRLTDSVELALSLGKGLLTVAIEGGEAWLLSEQLFCPPCGVRLPPLDPRLFSFNGPHGACPTCTGLGTQVPPPPGKAPRLTTRSSEGQEEEPPLLTLPPCPACHGARLRREALALQCGGFTFAEVGALPLAQLPAWIPRLAEGPRRAQQKAVAADLSVTLAERVQFLLDVGLGYLTLDRAAHTLSTGEGQRIRLATQLGSKLSGVLYVLDEPSRGLHPRDQEPLLLAQKRLRDLGNTVIVIEHTRAAMLAADHLVDMGPGAGIQGGQVVAQGTLHDILANPTSETGPWLSGAKTLPIPTRRRVPTDQVLAVRGARTHTLQTLDVEIPLGLFTCVTGVSGSGKSSLVMGTLLPAAQGKEAACDRLEGLPLLTNVVHLDSTPLGRTPRASPATTTGLLTDLRALYASLPEAKARGYKAARFSSHLKGGRCETCEGEGFVRVAMHFLPDLFVPCDVCEGKRYNRETLAVRYRGLSIADALALTVTQSLDLFAPLPALRTPLEAMERIGLGYLTLGQPAHTLSGGEAQRVKLACALTRKATGRTLYLLDEPTAGLHWNDLERLVAALQQLCDQGNTVVAVEHNMEVVACADWVIDLGPEAGAQGGQVIATGPPEQIAQTPTSHTGRYLQPLLQPPSPHTQGLSS